MGVSISVRFDGSTFDAVRRRAQQSRKSFSELVRDAVREYVQAGSPPTDSDPDLGWAEPRRHTRLARRDEEVTGDLIRKLRDARSRAAEGDVVVRIHLFGIDHAKELQGVDLNELVAAAGVPKPYTTEIRKGMRLAEYVTRK